MLNKGKLAIDFDNKAFNFIHIAVIQCVGTAPDINSSPIFLQTTL